MVSWHELGKTMHSGVYCIILFLIIAVMVILNQVLFSQLWLYLIKSLLKKASWKRKQENEL